MTIFWISLAAVLLFVVVGYRRGVLRIVAFLGALLLAGLAARPLAGWFLPLVERAGFVPKSLLPVAAPLVAGLVVLIVLDVLMTWLLKRRERNREAQKLPRLEPWEQLSGAVLGGLWGCGLVALVLSGLHLLGRVELELTRPPAPPPGWVETPTSQSTPVKTTALKSTYRTINAQIDASPLAGVVQRVNPSEERIARLFGDLAKITADPVLLERFRKHPSIARLIDLPQLKELAQDAAIQQLLQDRQYYALLDHPKLAALLQDKALVKAVREVDLEAVLAETQQQPPR